MARKTLFIINFLGAFAISTAAGAQTRSLVCNTDVDPSGWVGGTYQLIHDEAADTVVVSDAISASIYGEPVAVNLREATEKKRVYTWDVRSRDTAGQLVRMSYRLAVFMPKMNVTVRAKPLGYSNDFSRRGTCKWDG